MQKNKGMKFQKSSLLFLMATVTVVTLLINGCKKEEDNLPLEPIAFIQPDTAIVRLFPGDTLPLQIQFTTDRPINWVKAMMDLDTTNAAYTPTYPDTLFLVKLDTLEPRVNRYTYTGSIKVADTLQPFDILRFKVSFNAGKTSFTTGQNYPAGIVSSSKEFRIDIR